MQSFYLRLIFTKYAEKINLESIFHLIITVYFASYAHVHLHDPALCTPQRQLPHLSPKSIEAESTVILFVCMKLCGLLLLRYYLEERVHLYISAIYRCFFYQHKLFALSS